MVENNLLLIENPGMKSYDQNQVNVYGKVGYEKNFNNMLLILQEKVIIPHNNQNYSNIRRSLKYRVNQIQKEIGLDKIKNNLLSQEEWNQLNIVEREYANYVIDIMNRPGTLRGSKLYTIYTSEKKNYKDKPYYSKT
jgi:hypothetical protein